MHQGEERNCDSKALRRANKEFCCRSFLGSRVFCLAMSSLVSVYHVTNRIQRKISIIGFLVNDLFINDNLCLFTVTNN